MILTSLFCDLKKVFIQMNTWIVGKDLMKIHFQSVKFFTVNYILKILLMKTIYMLKKVFKEFEIKKQDEYHDSYVQRDTLLPADVCENFRNKCIKIYELDPTHFLSAPGLARQACLKKTGEKLELLTNKDMLMIFEKGIRCGICHGIHWYAKANNST